MANKLKELIIVLTNMRRVAIVKKDIPFVYLRFLTWQIRIRFNQDKKIINWVNQRCNNGGQAENLHSYSKTVGFAF